MRGDQAWVEAILDRAVAAGFGALCLTVDTHHYSRRERDISKRFQAASTREVDASRHQKALDWKQVDKVKKRYKLPLVIKGIATAEDAKLAVEHGVDVIYVSNHGGRQLDHGLGSLDVLPEIVAAAKGRAEIIVDGGFCRGSDLLKAYRARRRRGEHRPALRLRHGGGGPRRHPARAGAAARRAGPQHGPAWRQPPGRARSVLSARRAAGAAAARAERVPFIEQTDDRY